MLGIPDIISYNGNTIALIKPIWNLLIGSGDVLSIIGRTLNPLSLSKSPWRWNSCVILSLHFLYKPQGLADELTSLP